MQIQDSEYMNEWHQSEATDVLYRSVVLLPLLDPWLSLTTQMP